MKIPPHIFRSYDIRGVVDTDLTLEAMYCIGEAIGIAVQENTSDHSNNKVIVARDGRLSGPALSEALIEGIIASGGLVYDIGMVPTPVLYFATQFMNIPSGVIVTGSHNPAEFNGLKIVLQGQSLCEDSIKKIHDLTNIQANAYASASSSVSSKTFLTSKKIMQKEITTDYIQAICQNINITKQKKPLRVVVDCGNGVAGKIAPALYSALGCSVIPLFCDVDGRFPNHHPDPANPKNLASLINAVLQNQADIGLAFDGDGDRLGVVDNAGNIIWPDRQLMLFARKILSLHPNASVVYDVKCTRHIQQEIKNGKGNPILCRTGHSHIKAKMKESGALLGGEMSGHLFFKDRWYGFDDALYAGARLLEILSETTCPSSELFSSFPNSVNTPEITLPVSDTQKFDIVQKIVENASNAWPPFKEATISTIDGLRVDFDYGFGLVRPSNTGPNIVMRFEADTEPLLQQIQAQFRQLLLRAEPNFQLPF